MPLVNSTACCTHTAVHSCPAHGCQPKASWQQQCRDPPSDTRPAQPLKGVAGAQHQQVLVHGCCTQAGPEGTVAVYNIHAMQVRRVLQPPPLQPAGGCGSTQHAMHINSTACAAVGNLPSLALLQQCELLVCRLTMHNQHP